MKTQHSLDEGRRAPGRPLVGSGDSREALLVSALGLFSQRGVGATTLPQISRAAHVTPAMAHYYFGSREGLIDAVVEEKLLPAFENLWTGLVERQPETPEAFMACFLDQVFALVDLIPGFPQLWAREILTDGGLLRERMLSRILPMRIPQKIGDIIRRGQAEGRINAGLEPTLMLPTLIGAIMCPLAASHIVERISDANREGLRRHILALLLNGLRPAEKKEEVAKS